MKVLKYPVISLTVLFALGIAVGHYLKINLATVAIVFVVALCLVGTSYFQASKKLIPGRGFIFSAWLFSFVLGTTAYVLHYAPNHTSHYSHRILKEEIPVIQGVIIERLKPNKFAEKYYFDVTSLNRQAATGKLLVTVPKDSTSKTLNPGDKLAIVENLKPISRSLNPYQFDYSEYMASQNIFHQVKLKDNFVTAGTEKNFDYYVGKLRNSLTESFSIHHYNPEINIMIRALLFGQRQDMDEETTANYTNAGVVHILAISGLHIAVLFYILNLLLKPLQRLKKGKLLQLILVLSFLWLFAFLSGLSASVVRSVVMFSFVSIGLYFNRSSNIYNSIAVSMLFLLLVKPMFLFDVGFQLSYAAVFAIVWLQPIYSKVRTSKYKAVNYVADTVLISLVAQIGVLPLSLYYFNQFPVLFLLANVVVVPLSTIILIVGIIVLALNFIWPDAALLIGKLLLLLIDWMNNFTYWIASFDKLVLKDIPFTMLLNISLYLVIIATVYLLYKKTYLRAVSMLSSIIVFQVLFMVTSQNAGNSSEFVVFNNWGNSIIAVKQKQNITAYTNDSLGANNRSLTAYNKGNFNQELKLRSLKNVYWFNNKKILLLDSLGVCDNKTRPDVLILTQSPKVNLERLIGQIRPKQIIADATNYKTYIARWAETCQKQKIPFHATAEKGFCKID